MEWKELGAQREDEDDRMILAKSVCLVGWFLNVLVNN